MEWIALYDNSQVMKKEIELPISGTKVIVQTESKAIIGKEVVYVTKGNILRVSFHLDKEGKPVWGCNNQIVTHYLKEGDNKLSKLKEWVEEERNKHDVGTFIDKQEEANSWGYYRAYLNVLNKIEELTK